MYVAETGEIVLSLDEFMERWLRTDPLPGFPERRPVRITDGILGMLFNYRFARQGIECGFSTVEFNREVIRRLTLETEEIEKESAAYDPNPPEDE